MASRSRDAVVSKIIEEGCDARTLRVEFQGGEPFDFAPGQYVRVAVPEDAGPGHPCPISSSPLERGHLEMTVRGRSDSSRGLFALQGGETVRVSGPEGSWVYQDEVRNAVLLAEGAAVAACRSMIRYVLDKGLPNNLTLFYAEKAPACILFRQELEEFSRKGVRVVVSVNDPGMGGEEAWSGPTGPITAEALRRVVGRLKEPVYYVHGPSTFVGGMLALLGKAGVAPERVLAREGAMP